MAKQETDILSMTGEPAVLIKGGRISFANAAACRIIGSDYSALTPSEVFGACITGFQGGSFTAGGNVCGTPCVLRISRAESGMVIFFVPTERVHAVMNDAFIFSMRSELMNLSMCLEAVRASGEADGNSELCSLAAAGIRSQSNLMRVLNNASLVCSLAEGNAPFCPAAFDLSALCDGLIATLESFFPDVSFVKNYAPTTPVCADRSLISQLLLNLISNALTHGEGLTRISISLIPTENSVTMSVDDDGCGIAPELLPTVFDRYRFKAGLGSVGAGVGLGFTVARGITALHGGTLILESKPGRGTAVRASISRGFSGSVPLRSEDVAPEIAVRDILTALSDCLGEKFYSAEYSD